MSASAYALNLEAIEQWYKKTQSHFSLVEIDKELGTSLLIRQPKEQEPVHNWYILKEAYSLQLPVWIINRIKTKFNVHVKRVCDPFLGCGTTGHALFPLGINVDGIEHNPFIRFAATTKSNAGRIDRQLVKAFIESDNTEIPIRSKLTWPELSTIHWTTYFRRDDIRFLLHMLQKIEDEVSDQYTKDFLRLGVARSVEPISNLYKDGRALRYIKKRHRPTATQVLAATWNNMLNDLSQHDEPKQTFKVFAGDARDLTNVSLNGQSLSIESDYYDAVLYSPPYLNNFDYSEIYKIELWLLGFVSSYEEWRNVRLKTIRSHHSLKFADTRYLWSDTRTRHVAKWIDAIANSEELHGYAAANMPPIIRGYFDDMYLALKEQYRILKPGGFLAYVVANSRHSNLPIATDIIIGEIARNLGFNPIELIILKKRNGRTKQKNFLRESLVIMQKPK